MHPIRKLEGFTGQTGFTLMELMVGMTIGMIATIIIVQVMSVFEAQKRTTTGSADAQTNGGIALYSIAREMQMAGYPMFPGADTALSCTTITYGGTGITDISPVSITEVAAVAGVSAASDSITIRYGSSTTTGAVPGASPGVQTPINSMDIPTKVATVGSHLGCQANASVTSTDATMINTGAICAMSTLTAVTTVPGTPNLYKVTLNDTTGAIPKANLACLGPWNEVTYAVNAATGNLERTVRINGVLIGTTPSVVGIVNLQAQYGISATASSNQVTSWVDASGATWGAAALALPANAANRNRIKAVRIAIVARNAKMEQSAVSTACSSTTAANPTGLCAWDGSAFAAPAIDLSQGDANWAKYRYRVFETTISLRNVMWSKDTL
jgi:type IV pilus assembly protein PilW